MFSAEALAPADDESPAPKADAQKQGEISIWCLLAENDTLERMGQPVRQKHEKPLSLTDREKEQLKAMIDAGQPLPPRYKEKISDTIRGNGDMSGGRK